MGPFAYIGAMKHWVRKMLKWCGLRKDRHIPWLRTVYINGGNEVRKVVWKMREPDCDDVA